MRGISARAFMATLSTAGRIGSDSSQPVDVLIEFTRAWGHPTRNEIYGPGDRARVSERIAAILCREDDAYAKRVGGKGK